MRKILYSILTLGTIAGIYLAFFHQGGTLPPIKEVDSMDWNPSNKYALVLERDYAEHKLENESVVVKYNSEKRVSEFIRVPGKYQTILKTPNGLALKKDRSLLCLNDYAGKLVRGKCDEEVSRNVQYVDVSTKYVNEGDELVFKRYQQFADDINSDLFIDQSTEKTYNVPQTFENYGEKYHLYVSDIV